MRNIKVKIEYVDESLNPDTIRKQVQEKLPMPSMPQALSEKQAGELSVFHA